MGPGYRNVIGLPGGVNSPLFKVLEVPPVRLICQDSREGPSGMGRGIGCGCRQRRRNGGLRAIGFLSAI